ncbi:hypothetical protein ACROYT_G001761 [Oculina patagonica]
MRQCRINGRCYSYNTVNPSNPCQKCNINRKTTWTNDNALSCNDGNACTRNDRCFNGRCIGTVFLTCLSCEECYKETCRVKPGYCSIMVGGVRTCFNHGDLRPGYECQQCDSNNQHQWTSNNYLQCSDNNIKTKDRCVNGACVGTLYDCLSCERHDGKGCPVQPGYCTIHYNGQRTCFAKSQYKPGNPCQWCDPGSSTSTWSNREGVACDDGNKCTGGDTCRSGQCTATPFTCNSHCQYCNGTSCSLKTGFGFANNKCTCKIAGQDYSHQMLNPSNQCQWCDLYDAIARANSDWSNRPTVPCDDGNKCTKQDTCKAGRCSGLGYSCQSSYPPSRCIKTSECVGDGTCRSIIRTNGTLCRPAVDLCDQPERCDGVLGTCPGQVTDEIVLKTGILQMMDSKFQSVSTYQYITDRLFLNISGFSVSCGQLNLRWFVLLGSSPCSFNSSATGTLPDTNVYQTITGLTLQDNTTYKVSVKASDERGKTYQLVCSSEVVVDTSKPQGGWIRDGPGADLSYQASTLLQANWGGVQTRHGVGKYEWKVLLTSFNTNQTSELMPFTSTNLNTNTNTGKTFKNIADGSKARFVIRAYTKAGLYSDFTSDGVVIDTSPPVAGKIYDGSQLGVDVKYAKWTSTFTANWDRFTDPHSPISRYTWAVQRIGAGLITSFKTTALNRSPTATNLNLVSKERYCAVVRGYNEAGLYTQVKSDSVLIDHDAPQAGIVNDGHFSDVDYQSEDTMIAANWNGFTDGSKGSGIAEYRYKIADSNGNIIVPWTSAGNATNITHDGLTLKNNTKYFVTVKAVDTVDLSTDVTSDGITVDATHPVFTGKVLVTGEDDFINGTPCVYIPSVSSVSVQWVSFSDAHSGLLRYDWAIISSDMSPSSSNFTTVPGSNLPTSATFTGLALSQGRRYYTIIRAYNRAKMFKDAYSVLVIPDATPPAPRDVSDGPTPQVDIEYQADLKYVSGSWTKFSEPHTAVKQYYYAVGSCITGNYHVTGNGFIRLDPPKSTSFMLTNIVLNNGQKYCIKIKAENKAGLISLEVSSNGFIADVTAPNVYRAQVRDGNTGLDIDYQANTTGLSAEWDGFVDSESGIHYYEYGVSRSRGGTPDLCAVNNAGLRKCISSDGVLIDMSLPSHGVVHDGVIEPDLKYQSSLSSMAANWEGIWDLDSGVEKFEWSIGTSKHDKTSIKNYTDVGLSTHVRSQTALNLVSGTKYHVHLKVTNQAGAIKELVSDGVIVDGTPPVPSKVYPGLGSRGEWKYNDQESTFYSASALSIAAYWNRFSEPESEVWYYKWAIDPESGIRRCNITVLNEAENAVFFAIRNTSAGNATLPGGITLPQGKYNASVECINNADLASSSSSVFVIDTTPPIETGPIIAGVSRDHFFQYQSDTGSITASWPSFKDLESGIENYYFAIGTQPYQDDVVSVVLSAHWENITDPESGIMQNEYCLGTKPLGCQIKPMTSTGTNKSFTCPECSIHEGDKVFVTVRVTNGAGLSETVTSDGMLLDVSPPVMGDVVDGSHVTGFDYNVVLEDWNISMTWFGVEDAESGVRSCRWTIENTDGVILFERKITNNSRVEPIWPIPAPVRDGSIPGTDQVYLTNTKRVGAHWDPFPADNRDPVVGYEMAIGTAVGKEDILHFTSVGLRKSIEKDLAPNIPDLDILEAGKIYYVTIKATTLSGLSSIEHSDGFTVDPSPPLKTEVSVSHKVVDQEMRTVEISVSWNDVKDDESGISSSGYCLKTTPGTCGSGLVPAGSSTFGTIGPFRPEPWVEYFVTVVVVNGAGLKTVMSSKKLVFDTSPPSVGSVIDGIGQDIDFMNSTNFLSAQWEGIEDEESGVASCSWALIEQSASQDRSVFGNDTVMLTKAVESKGNLTQANLDLVPGARYISQVTCTNADGFSSTSSSDGVIVDITSPNPGKVHGLSQLTDIQFQSSATLVEAVWNPFKDQESGIVEYRWGLGTTPDEADAVNFTAVGRLTSGKADNVLLTHSVKYYVIVEAVNGAGMTSRGWSRVFVVDITPPEITEVTSGSKLWIGPTDDLRASWKSHDLESGIEKTEFCVGTLPVGCQIKSMTEIPPNATDVTCSDCRLSHYGTYYLSIRVTNGAGLFTVIATNETRVDLTAPFLGDIIPQFSVTSCVTKCTLVSNITGVQDDESGVRLCSYAIRKSTNFVTDFIDNGLSTTVQATGLQLQPGQSYYTVVKCENNVGIATEMVSSPVIVDNTPPSKGSVIVSEDRTHDVFGIHSSCHLFNKTLRAHWYGFNDKESEISGFRVAVGKQANATDVLQFQDVGLVTNVTLPLANISTLFDGDIVYVTVESRNGAGLATQSSSPPTRLIAADSEQYLREGDFYCLNV